MNLIEIFNPLPFLDKKDDEKFFQELWKKISPHSKEKCVVVSDP